MTEPTDAELLAELDRVSHMADAGQRRLACLRAVLAKWGTPPAVAGEPIGHLYCGGSYGDELADWEIVADQHQCDKLNEHHGSLGKEAKLPIYATPQPTQAQAGAVPLTVDEVEQLIAQWSYELHGDRARYLVRMTEQHHGIKGKETGNAD